MLWGQNHTAISLDGVGAQELFAEPGDLFMASFSIINALPFWILGVPLVIAVVSYMRMPRQRDLVPTHDRADHQNGVREPAARRGDNNVSRG